jgi:two-component system sensor histidine kinase KdpD
MDWSWYKALRQLREWGWWKRLFIDIIVAVLPVAVVTIPAIFLLHPHERIVIPTVQLVYLIIILFLAHKLGHRAAILAAVLACIAFDFFLLQPFFSLWVGYLEDAIELCIFLVVAILLSWTLARQRKLVEQAKRHSYLEITRYEERLRKQEEEVSRRYYELHAVYDVIAVMRDQKDLKSQLSLMAKAIADTFNFCGIRGCAFYLPDLESSTSMWILSSPGESLPGLAQGDEASVAWVFRNGKAVTLTEVPTVTHTRASYVRRVVKSNTGNLHSICLCNFLVPLRSGQQTLGVMRLFVQDDGNPDLTAIKGLLEKDSKNILEKDWVPPSKHCEHFFMLLSNAVILVEQSLIERALMQKESLRQELQKRTEEMHTAIISSVSHDFHTPLTMIKGAATSLLNRPGFWENETSYRDPLQDIVSEVEWLERIVAKMLSLSRIEQGGFTLKRELYPIEMVILNALDQGHMRSLKKGRQIEIVVPDDIPAVEIDPDLIGQVFTNLIENAIRYTPVESPIEISARADDSQLYVTVADRGRGIPLDELDHIFERFYRGKRRILDHAAPVTDQGSGLGLAVCQGFVQAHGGRIRAENREDGGAIFQFTLPLHAAEGIANEKNTRG